MEFSRRTFLKGTVLGGAGLSALGFDLTPLHAQTQGLKISRASETRDKSASAPSRTVRPAFGGPAEESATGSMILGARSPSRTGDAIGDSSFTDCRAAVAHIWPGVITRHRAETS